MSLKINRAWLIILFAIILLIVSVSLFFPSVTNNVLSGLAPFDSFAVTLSATHVDVNISNRTQIDIVVVNATNITIKAPIIYYGNIVMNLSLDIPSGFECVFGWYINESGVIKNVTDNGTTLSWEANKIVNNTFLYFEAPPPSITSMVALTGDSYYEKTLTIDSCCPLITVFVNVTINQNYTSYTLYQIINGSLVNKTDDYSLVVSNGTASFSGFNLSNKTFRLTAEPAPEVIQTIIQVGSTGGGGGGGLAIPVINYTPTKAFLVEPNYINVVTTVPGIYESIMTIYNLRGEEKNFTINHTNLFVYDLISVISIPHKEYEEVSILMNASSLQPGKYTDYIYISDGDDLEKVTISIEILEMAQGEAGALPQEQQPGLIDSGEEEPDSAGRFSLEQERKFSLLGILLTLLAGLMFVSGVIYLHLKGKH